MDNNNNKQESIGFSLRSLSTTQFATIDENFDNKAPVTYSSSCQFQLDIERKVVVVATKAKFLQKNFSFLIIETTTAFNIQENSWDEFSNKEPNKIIFPKDFLAHLAFIAFGTLRGVLHAKTENTPYNKFVLPTINVLETITEDLIINIVRNEEEIK